MRKGIPIIGIVFLLIGLFSGYLSLKLMNEDNPMEAQTIQDASYVGNNGVLEENDGKIIIINGPVELLEAALDKDLNISINSPRVAKETFLLTQMSDEKASWESKSKDYLLADVKISGFHISAEIVERFKLDKTYTDFNIGQLESSRLSLVEDSTSSQRHFLIDENEQVRYHYSAFDMEKAPIITLTGRQNGNTLEYVDTMKSFSIAYDELNQDELLKYMKDAGLTTAILAITLSILFLILGTFRIVRWLGI